jgi:hypothetical protein
MLAAAGSCGKEGRPPSRKNARVAHATTFESGNGIALRCSAVVALCNEKRNRRL